MNTLSATNTTLVIDNAKSVLIIGNGIDRTGLFTGTGELRNSTVGAGCGTESALLTLHRINMCTLVGHRDGSEMTAVLAGFSETETAVVRYGVGRNRALFASRIDNLDDIVRFTMRICIFIAGQTHPPT